PLRYGLSARNHLQVRVVQFQFAWRRRDPQRISQRFRPDQAGFPIAKADGRAQGLETDLPGCGVAALRTARFGGGADGGRASDRHRATRPVSVARRAPPPAQGLEAFARSSRQLMEKNTAPIDRSALLSTTQAPRIREAMSFSIRQGHDCTALVTANSAIAKHQLTSLCSNSANSAFNSLTGKPLLEYIQTLQISRTGLVNKCRLEESALERNQTCAYQNTRRTDRRSRLRGRILAPSRRTRRASG